ncbi:hypothetical protein ACJMK2_026181 [Sinanodonta woodiana]|uniref:Uncharacterized protein n=1 Tax=Sinanodonta woodiana TaxID=1069815 RepID=A0ABD3XIU2_SINWO
MSLHNLMDPTQNSFNPLRNGLSSQGLYYSSHTLDRSLVNINVTEANAPIKRKHLSNCEEENHLDDMSRLDYKNNLKCMYANNIKDKKTKRAEQNDEAESETLNSLQKLSFDVEPQENIYYVLSLYDDARDNITNENLNEAQIVNRHEEFDNNYADSHCFKHIN